MVWRRPFRNSLVNMTSSFESTNQVSTAISTAFSQVNAEANALETKVAAWAELEDRVRHNLHNQPNIITLNVGGTTFQTSKDTLLRGGGTYFHALLGSGQWKPEGGEGPNSTQNLHNQPDIITLNVGGTTFQTSKDTILRGEGTYIHSLLGSGQWKPEGGEGYFLDLDPTLFRRVLFFLRTGKIMPLDGLTEPEQDEFAAMLEYLKMDKRAQAQAIR
ncbi:hypothetical protein DYB30_011102, partial [Aphanomyces astaci]